LTHTAGSGYSPFVSSNREPLAPTVADRRGKTMDLDHLAQIAANFYYAHKMGVIIGAAALIILILLKPKPMLKTIGLLLAIAVAVYIVMLIIDVIFSGVEVKEKMIHKSE
jgi:hypothetical protein